MSMRLLGGIWLVIRLSPLKPKIRNIIIIIIIITFVLFFMKREIEIHLGKHFPSCSVGIKVLGHIL